MTIRAAVYLRISKDATGEGLGVERQRAACVALCEDRDWTPIIYCDNDVSAFGRAHRPKYEAMLADIEAGRIDAVVVWDLDRLTRRPIEIETFIDLADRHKVKLQSIGGDIDISTDNGRMYARIKGAVARAEVERKSVRQIAAAQQRAESGLPYLGGRRAFGFKSDHVSHHPEESTYVREMYERFTSGDTLSGIAKWLNASGVSTTRGGAWSHDKVRLVLKNPRYAGKRAVRPLVDHASGRRAREYEVVADGQWEPLIDEAVWQAVNARLADPLRRSNPLGGARKYLLTGLALCGRAGCGQPVKVGWRSPSKSPEATRAVLKCPTNHLARSMSPIDELVEAVVIKRLRGADAAPTLRVETPGARDQVDWAMKARAARHRLGELADDYGAMLLTRAEYMAARSAAMQVAEEAEARLAAAGVGDPVGRVLASGVDPAEAWSRMTLGARRNLIAALFRITLLPAKPGRGGFDPDTVRFDPVR